MKLKPKDRLLILRAAVSLIDQRRCLALREGNHPQAFLDEAVAQLARQHFARIWMQATPPRISLGGVSTSCTAGGWSLLLQWRAKASAEIERLQAQETINGEKRELDQSQHAVGSS